MYINICFILIKSELVPMWPHILHQQQSLVKSSLSPLLCASLLCYQPADHCCWWSREGMKHTGTTWGLFTRPCRWESLWMEPELACRLHVIYRLLFGNTHRKKSSLLQTFSVLSLMRWGKPGQISSYTRVSHHPFISQSEVTQLNVRKIITAGADGNVVTGMM